MTMLNCPVSGCEIVETCESKTIPVMFNDEIQIEVTVTCKHVVQGEAVNQMHYVISEIMPPFQIAIIQSFINEGA